MVVEESVRRVVRPTAPGGLNFVNKPAIVKPSQKALPKIAESRKEHLRLWLHDGIFS